MCKGGLYRGRGYQANCSLNGSKQESSMKYNHVVRLKISTPSSLLRWRSDTTSPAKGKVYQLLHLRPFMSESNFPNVCKCLMTKTD
jgi:hypothetical protein